MRLANLALRFLLELAALAAYAWAAFVLIPHPVWSWVGAVVAAVAFVGVWGGFLAPTSPRRLRPPWLNVAALAIFALAAFLLVLAGALVLAIVFAALAALNEVLLVRWGQYAEFDRMTATRSATSDR